MVKDAGPGSYELEIERQGECWMPECEDCHVLTERIKNLAHWIMEGEALSTLLPSDKQQVSLEILKLVKPLPVIIGCDRCAMATIVDFDGWKIPQPGDFDDVTLCPKCQKETNVRESNSQSAV